MDDTNQDPQLTDEQKAAALAAQTPPQNDQDMAGSDPTATAPVTPSDPAIDAPAAAPKKFYARPSNPATQLADLYHATANKIEAAADYVEGAIVDDLVEAVEAVEVSEASHPLVFQYKADMLAYLKSL